LQGAPNGQRVGLAIPVTPLEPDRLALPESDRQREREPDAVSPSASHVKYLTGFVDRQRNDFRFNRRWRRCDTATA
jgi:hypothetical protein